MGMSNLTGKNNNSEKYQESFRYYKLRKDTIKELHKLHHRYMTRQTVNVKKRRPWNLLLHNSRTPVIQPTPWRKNKRPPAPQIIIQYFHQVCHPHVYITPQVKSLTRIDFIQQISDMHNIHITNKKLSISITNLKCLYSPL